MDTGDINEYLKPAFDAIMAVLPKWESGERTGLMIRDPSRYDGWVDGKEGVIYVAVFDKRYEKGQKLSDLFKRSKTKEDNYRFVPAPNFSFNGKLILHGEHNQLEWIVLECQ